MKAIINTNYISEVPKIIEIEDVTTFVAPEKENFPYWTFWASSNEEGKIDIHFIPEKYIIGIQIEGGELINNGTVSQSKVSNMRM